MLQHMTHAMLSWWDSHLGVNVQPVAVDLRPGCIVWTVRGDVRNLDMLERYEEDLVYAVTGTYTRPHLLAVVERVDARHARVGIGAPASLPGVGVSGVVASVAHGNGPPLRLGAGKEERACAALPARHGAKID
jgi:hypothetical protein